MLPLFWKSRSFQWTGQTKKRKISIYLKVHESGQKMKLVGEFPWSVTASIFLQCYNAVSWVMEREFA